MIGAESYPCSRDFYERRSSEKSITGDSPEMLWLVENIVEELNMKSGDFVLDVGCGDGYVLERIHDKADIIGFGIDVSAKAVRTAQALARNSGKDIAFVVSDAEHLPFVDNAFDKAICSEIVEHIPDDQRFLNEMNRVLRPCALAYVTFPNREMLFLFKPHSDNRDIIEGHLRRYELEGTEEMLRGIGFETIRARFVGHLLMWLVRQLVTYNTAAKALLRNRYLHAKLEARANRASRPDYMSGVLPSVFRVVFMVDLMVGTRDCLEFYIVLEKAAHLKRNRAKPLTIGTIHCTYGGFA